MTTCVRFPTTTNDDKNPPLDAFNLRDSANRRLALLAKFIFQNAAETPPGGNDLEPYEQMTLAEMLEDVSAQLERAQDQQNLEEQQRRTEQPAPASADV